MRKLPIIAATVFSMAAALVAGPAAAECVFAKLGEMKVDPTPGRLTVDVEVNGVKAKMMINTASGLSRLTRAGAEKLGARGFDTTPMITPSGETTYNTAELRNLVVGGAFRIPIMTLSVGGENAPDSEIVGYLGRDIMGAADVEFDLANNRIAFYQPKGCEKADLIYWSPNFSLAPIGTRGALALDFMTAVVVNGKPMDAMISTGTTYSVMDQAAAKTVGVTAESPGVGPLITDRYDGMNARIGTFDTFAIGDEQVKNVKMVFGDLWSKARSTTTGSRVSRQIEGFPEVQLGLDFLRAHRVLLAKSQGRMYMTYNGGGIFKTPSP